MDANGLDEQRVAAYVRGDLDEAARATVEAALDADPKWLAVVAVMARAEARPPSRGDDPPIGGVPPAGTRVGRYTVGEPLGRGATGVVLGAWDPELRRDVALKLVEPSLLSSPVRAQARLSREAKALARVADPHVVRVFDVGLWQRRVFVAMERLDGGTLDHWRSERSRTWREIVKRWLDAGDGLAAAHAQGLVHRDFKPANVMLDGDGRVVVVDFGLARQATDASPESDTESPVAALAPATASHDLHDLTRTGASVGTPAYMPREQRAGRAADPAADQYAFCVSLYEALAGVLPSGFVRVAMPPVADRVPRKVWQLLERGRAEQAGDRFDGMRPLLDALARCVDGGRGWMTRGVAAVLAVGVGALALFDDDDRCGNGQWPSPAQGVVAGLRERPEPFADALADRVAEHTDRFVHEWSAQRTLACGEFEASVIDGAELDRRVHCLDAQHRRASAVLDALRNPDARALRHADRIVALLPTAARCAEPEDAPLDEPTRRRVEAIVDGATELEMGRILGATGGVQRAEALVVRADDLGRPRQRASARQQLGLEYETEGELVAAARAYRQGADIAMAGGTAGLAARLLVRAAWVIGYGTGDVEEGRRLAGHAEAWSKRAGIDAAIEADRLQTLGFIELTAGELDASAEAFAAAQVQAEAIAQGHPEREELIVVALNGLGSVAASAGRLEDARRHLSHAVALQAERVGEAHPTVAQIRNNVAGLLHAEGRSDEARLIFEANLEVFRRSYGETNPNVGATLTNLAVLTLDAGDGEAALRYAEAAYRIAKQRQGPTALTTAKALALRGEALHSQGQSDRGLGDLREARSILTATFGEAHSEVGLTDMAIAHVLLATARPDEALASYLASLSTLAAAWSDDDARLAKVWLGRGKAEHALGRRSDAATSFRRAAELDGGVGAEATELLAALKDTGADSGEG